MPEEITDVTIGRVYKEGKEAFSERRRHVFNPYVDRSRALASIWRNGWDAAQEKMESREPQIMNLEELRVTMRSTIRLHKSLRLSPRFCSGAWYAGKPGRAICNLVIPHQKLRIPRRVMRATKTAISR
jgi:hypothetical protein